MDLRTFLQKILPPTGNYFTANIRNKRMNQHLAPSLDVALHQVELAIKQRQDIYIATGSFHSARTIAECAGKRVLYVDIDCKIGGQYATKADAINAMKNAFKKGLPIPTLIVDTGHGFHLYWVLSEVALKAEWLELAQSLTFACAECKLNIDKGISTDAARILRVPGSINYKNPDAPVPCVIKRDSGPEYSIEEIAVTLNKFAALSPIAVVDENDDLSGGLTSGQNRPPPPAVGMLEGCPLFANNLKTQGAGTKDVIWHKILHTLAFTEDGAQYIHPISKGHDDYAPGATDARFAHAQRQVGRGGMGAVKCSTFKDAGAQECETCPMRDQGRSPISLAFMTAPTPVGELPFPFRNGPNGVERYDADTESWDAVLPEKITDFSASLEHGVTTHIAFSYGPQGVQMELADFASSQATHTVLGQYGLHLTRFQIEQVNMVTHSFMQELRRQGKLLPPIQSYGWVAGGFHAGETVHSGKTDGRNIKIDPQMIQTYTPKGELQIWKDCVAHTLSQDRPSAWTTIAAAFAGPLITFTGAEGAMLVVSGPTSGTGKSTNLKVGAATWGHPKDSVAHLNDTTNSVSARLGVIKNLPFYWDEIRGKEDVANFVKLIFRLSQGKDKQRLTSQIQQRKAGHWSTLMIVCTNEPIREHIARTVGNSDAGAARVFEIPADKISDDGWSDGEARNFYRRVEANFGGAGEVYAAYLGANKKTIEAAVAKVDAAICRQYNTTGDERYWVATVSTLLVGASIANKLGLTTFDMPVFKKYLLTQFEQMRAYKAEEFATGHIRAVRLLKRFLMEKAENTCFADHIPKKGQPGTMHQPADRPPTLIRIARVDKMVRISAKDFTDWVFEAEGAGGLAVVKELAQHGAIRTRGSLDAGSPKTTGARYMCLDVPFTGAFAELAMDAEPNLNADLG